MRGKKFAEMSTRQFFAENRDRDFLDDSGYVYLSRNFRTRVLKKMRTTKKTFFDVAFVMGISAQRAWKITTQKRLVFDVYVNFCRAVGVNPTALPKRKKNQQEDRNGNSTNR